MRRGIEELGLQLGLALTLLSLAMAAPATAGCTKSPKQEDQPQRFDLSLPDDETSVECRHEVGAPVWEWILQPDIYGAELQTYEFAEDGVHLNVRGSGVILVEIRFEGPGVEKFPNTLQLIVEESDLPGLADEYSGLANDPNPKNYPFLYGLDMRALVAHVEDFRRRAPTSIDMAIQLLNDRWDVELVMTARRINQNCWMSAWVTGDVPTTRHFSGDVAYFLASETPVQKGMMVGSLADAELHEMADGIGEMDVTRDEALDLAVRMGLMSAEDRNEMGRGDVDQERPSGSGEKFSEWVRQELQPVAGEDGDNFGLSLADVEMDRTDKTVGGAIKMFSSGFTLTLSGKADAANAPAIYGVHVDVKPSTVTATVGLLEGAGRIPFEMVEGAGLHGAFQTLPRNRDLIIGAVYGPLETKGVYTLEGIADSPRKLKIAFFAHFVAQRGSLSCQQ